VHLATTSPEAIGIDDREEPGLLRHGSHSKEINHRCNSLHPLVQ